MYPFVAIVGQERAKEAVLLSLVAPAIGGVLLDGEPGTAKSLLLHSAASLVPGMGMVKVPLHVGEDNLLGASGLLFSDEGERRNGGSKGRRKEDLERPVAVTLKAEHTKDFITVERPVAGKGLLARAHGKILYVDDIHLLPKTLSSLILDSASSGKLHLERNGVSREEESRFVLFATANLQEAPLSSQLLDRFGLYVSLEQENTVELRAKIIRCALEYEWEKENFIARYEGDTGNLREKLQRARSVFAEVQVSEELQLFAANLCREAGTVGNRSEIFLILAARARAALEERKQVNRDDIFRVASYVFPHRVSSSQSSLPQDSKDAQSSGSGEGQDNSFQAESEERSKAHLRGNSSEELHKDSRDVLLEHSAKEQPEDSRNIPSGHAAKESPNQTPGIPPGSLPEENADSPFSSSTGKKGESNTLENPDGYFSFPAFEDSAMPGWGSNRKDSAPKLPESLSGRKTRYRQYDGKSRDIALLPTFRSAIPWQRSRKAPGDSMLPLDIRIQDLKISVREPSLVNAVFFLVDASGSMGAHRRMAVVKAAVISMLDDAYRRRDWVGMMVFQKNRSELVLEMTRSVELAVRKLRELKTGGRTPLAEALLEGGQYLDKWCLREPLTKPLMVVVTDGRGNVSHREKDFFYAASLLRNEISEKIGFLVIDTEKGRIRLGLAEKLAWNLQAGYLRMDDYRSRTLIEGIDSYQKGLKV